MPSTLCFESSTRSPFCFAMEAATTNRIRVRLKGEKTDYSDESHATAGKQQEFREPLDSLSCLQPGQNRRKAKIDEIKGRKEERKRERKGKKKKRKKEESESFNGEFDEKVPGKLVALPCSARESFRASPRTGKSRCSLIFPRKTSEYLNFDPSCDVSSNCYATVTVVIVIT